MKKLVLLLIFSLTLPLHSFDSQLHQQALVVIADSWDSCNARMWGFAQDGQWQQELGPIEVSLGANGLAWAHGLHGDCPKESNAPIRKMLDNRSPAGIYELANAFGFQSYKDNKIFNYPYVQFTSSMEWVDDPSSKHFNTLQDTSVVEKDWDCSEQLGSLRYRNVYEYGVVIDFNTKKVKLDAGSAIFMHIWQKPHHPTAGCTAMSKENMIRCLKWLDADKRPVIIQLTEDNYIKYKNLWNIPEIIDLKNR